METRMKVLIAVFLLTLAPGLLPAARADQPAAIDAKQQQVIIDDISKLLNENYVYAETAGKMANRIQERMKSGAYQKLTDPDEFAEAVYDDLEKVSNDKHLGFSFGPDRAAEILKEQSQNEAEARQAREQQLAGQKRDNFGFRRVERLPGNIGYLDFRYFADAANGGETAIAALTVLSHCDAIIIDLRLNGGGDPTQIQLISSYFFADPTHLNDIYNRKENSTEHYWTYRYVPGNRMDKVDLYILTSKVTFSGAEEFCYNMKNLKRATLIGETTGGGAHPTDAFVVQARYVLRIPTARAINPITKTNWEGVGVTPDIAVPQDQAYDRAYAMALEKLAAKTTDPGAKSELDWTLAGMRARANPVRVADETLQKYAGVYEERKVTWENGSLYYQRTGPKYKLIPMSETLFALEGEDGFRLEFVMDNGKPVKVIGHYVDGTDESKRTD